MSTSDRQYHHGDLRRALVMAATALLTERGPTALSLREAAKAAGVSHNAPYRHFRNREALLAAIAAEGFARLARHLAAVPPTPGGRLAALGGAYIDFARANPALYRLMFGAEVAIGEHEELRLAAEGALDQLRGALPAASTLRQDTIGAWALVHGLAHLLLDARLSEDLLSDPAARDLLIERTLGIFSHGLAARA